MVVIYLSKFLGHFINHFDLIFCPGLDSKLHTALISNKKAKNFLNRINSSYSEPNLKLFELFKLNRNEFKFIQPI